MKKLLVALTAALGFAAASVPASAGSSWSVSGGFYTAPTYSYNYVAPVRSYVAPRYTYVAPRYVAPAAPVVTFSFGSSHYAPHRGYRAHRAYRGHRHHRRHNRGYRHHW